MLPPIIDIEFSARCNLSCGFCFGPVDDKITPDLPTQFWLDTLDMLKNSGVKGIVVSGGEPTLHPHLESLLKRAKENYLSVVLSTHGRFKKRLLNVAQYCDWISLPVDGHSSEMNKKMRGDSWGINNAVTLAFELKKANPRLKIKLGTVATKVNVSDVFRLGEYLNELHEIPFDTWKIYQYTARRKFSSKAENYYFSDDDYAILKQNIESIKIHEKLNTVFSSNHARQNAYLFIYPDGVVALPNNGSLMKDVVIGNLFKEGIEVINRINSIADKNHLINYNATYNF